MCSFDSTRVVDSRLVDPGETVRRRRECAGCGGRFTTHERPEEVPVDVVKRDGTRQRFDRRKLLRGLVRAAGGRPVGGEALEALADAIAADVRSTGLEVSAERIGDLAERGLARIDPVTAIQFASVYRRLADLDELEEVVRRLRDERAPGEDQLPLGELATASFPSDPGGSMPSPATPLAEHGTSRRRRHAE